MTEYDLDFDPYRVAAVLYHPKDDIDTLLADFAADLVQAGESVGGVVQRNLKDRQGCQVGMKAVDVMTGQAISICQDLGSGAAACKLDPAGLADASRAVARAVAAGAALVIVNKFSKQEAAGRGLRNEIASAVLAGVPVLTAVPAKCLDAWKEFTGDRGTMLLCERGVLDAWWAETSARERRMRAYAGGAWCGETIEADATFRPSRPTI